MLGDKESTGCSLSHLHPSALLTPCPIRFHSSEDNERLEAKGGMNIGSSLLPSRRKYPSQPSRTFMERLAMENCLDRPLPSRTASKTILPSPVVDLNLVKVE